MVQHDHLQHHQLNREHENWAMANVPHTCRDNLGQAFLTNPQKQE